MASHDVGVRAIVQRKLAFPALGERLVDRERLTRRVRELLGRAGALVVYAAAGAGKTTAVALALRGIGRPTVWLSLDGTEAAAGRFLVYLEAAVAPHVPDARGAATDALAAGLPVGEAAGLLAESLHGSGCVLVCDNVERVADSDQAVAVLSALVRYVPADVGLVLISRSALPLDAGSTADLARISELDGSELAFTVDEAAEAMQLAGRSPDDAADMVRATGGWVAGVLFANGALAPGAQWLADYLTRQVLAGLSAEEHRFLVHTSLLDEVTAADATALGLVDVPRAMAQLRQRHLPVAWPDDRTLVVSPQLRDHLRYELSQEEPDTLRRLRLRHARLLVHRGEREEAVHALMAVGEADEAWAHAADLLPALIERMDFGPAARWLDELHASARSPSPSVGAVVLRVAFALEQVERAVELYSRHGRQWLDGLPQDDCAESLVLLAWALWHAGRTSDAAAVVDMLRPGRCRDIGLTLVGLSLDDDGVELPAFTATPSGPLDGLLMRLAFTRGHLAGLHEAGRYGPWRSVLGAPWVVAALRATGRIEEALALYETYRDEPQPLWLHGLDAVELMIDLGRKEDAWQALERGRTLSAASGSQIYTVLMSVMEAKVCLRLHHDPEAAHRALDDADAVGASRHAFVRELAAIWRGLAFLLRGRNAEAREVLEKGLASMQRADRMLEVPTAACYLAEACWRLGDEDASDEAAALAIRVAEERGTIHLLLAALSDVPAVAVRGADTEASRLSRWHELTAMLTNSGEIVVAARSPRLVLEDLGEPVIRLDGAPVVPRLRKSVELLAYLLAAPDRAASRQELLDALFDSRNEAAGRSYLRQALYRLREVLPPELGPVLDGDRFRLPAPDLVVSRSVEVLAAFDRAGRQNAENRIETLRVALAQTERGSHLQGMSGSWIGDRGAEIAERILRARLDLAREAFQLGRYREATENVDAVLRQDPFREHAWLLRLSLAQASGNDDHVLALYQRYVATMSELEVPPSAEVHRLVTQLRR